MSVRDSREASRRTELPYGEGDRSHRQAEPPFFGLLDTDPTRCSSSQRGDVTIGLDLTKGWATAIFTIDREKPVPRLASFCPAPEILVGPPLDEKKHLRLQAHDGTFGAERKRSISSRRARQEAVEGDRGGPRRDGRDHGEGAPKQAEPPRCGELLEKLGSGRRFTVGWRPGLKWNAGWRPA